MLRAAFAMWAVVVMGCAAKPTSSPAPPRHDHADDDHADDDHGHHAHHDMPHRFVGADEWAKRFDDPSRDAWQRPDAVIASLGLHDDDVVADVGAGTGYFAMRFALAAPKGKVFASEVEPDMVRYLGERAGREGRTNVVAVQGEATDPKVPEPADVVFLCNVIHHVGDRPALFAAIAKQLAADGRVVVVEFKPDAPEDAPGPPRKHRLAEDTVVRELATVGLQVVASDHDMLPYQYVLQFRAAR